MKTLKQEEMAIISAEMASSAFERDPIRLKVL
jgi:hypothetical protein